MKATIAENFALHAHFWYSDGDLVVIPLENGIH